MSDFKHFFGTAPSDQNALDLFAGEWSSQPPAARAELKAGATPLFDDPRITWAHHRLIEMGLEGGVTGREVLELGPLEGGHAYLLDRLGAKSITAVEANARAYLKCLVAKETFGIPRARFLLGDCLEFLKQTDRHFEVGIACGILYHLTNPVELLELLARRCDAIFLWTVFYDPEFVAKNPVPGAKFTDAVPMETAGFPHTVHRFNYGPSLDWKGFCGGGEVFSYWMEKGEILGALRQFGFTDFRTEEHPNIHGSALLVAARKAPAGSSISQI
ncbi:MAG: class I SAM-dependent methyltransferase [Opitutaceae bacterium]|nr:class I SAM-dependent methyltransferase [Opitutaceae bacterium]